MCVVVVVVVVCVVCVCGGGGTVNIIFLVTYDRHQQLLFSLQNISGKPRCVTGAFYRVRNLEGSGGTPPVWGQG